MNTLEHQLGIQQQTKRSSSVSVNIDINGALHNNDHLALKSNHHDRSIDEDITNAAAELFDELDDAQVLLEVDNNNCDNKNVWQLQNDEALNAFYDSSYAGVDAITSTHKNWSLTFRDVFNDDKKSDKNIDNINVYFR